MECEVSRLLPSQTVTPFSPGRGGASAGAAGVRRVCRMSVGPRERRACVRLAFVSQHRRLAQKKRMFEKRKKAPRTKPGAQKTAAHSPGAGPAAWCVRDHTAAARQPGSQALQTLPPAHPSRRRRHLSIAHGVLGRASGRWLRAPNGNAPPQRPQAAGRRACQRLIAL